MIELEKYIDNNNQLKGYFAEGHHDIDQFVRKVLLKYPDECQEFMEGDDSNYDDNGNPLASIFTYIKARSFHEEWLDRYNKQGIVKSFDQWLFKPYTVFESTKG